MKNFLARLIRALQEARLRRINHRSLADLDAHTLRDIGLQPDSLTAPTTRRTPWK